MLRVSQLANSGGQLWLSHPELATSGATLNAAPFRHGSRDRLPAARVVFARACVWYGIGKVPRARPQAGTHMGIQDRDYYREGPSFLDRVGEQGAVFWLILITVAAFIVQYLPGSPVLRAGEYNSAAVASGEVWRLVTPIFLHYGLWHLFFNMLALYWAGHRLEERYGSAEFTLFYLLAGTFAQTANHLIVEAGLDTPHTSAGASGAVCAVLVVFAFHFPRERILLFFVLPVPAWGLVALFVLLDVAGAAGMRQAQNIGFLVHLGGALFGALYHVSGVELAAPFRRSRRTRARPKLRVIPRPEPDSSEPVSVAVSSAPPPPAASAPSSSRGPADEQMEAKLNAVLEKVSASGIDSLTPEEREFLVKASEALKKRRAR
jgi:membrane associated rhomboid family serine protease